MPESQVYTGMYCQTSGIQPLEMKSCTDFLSASAVQIRLSKVCSLISNHQNNPQCHIAALIIYWAACRLERRRIQRLPTARRHCGTCGASGELGSLHAAIQTSRALHGHDSGQCASTLLI